MNDNHPWEPKFVAVVYRWSLFRGNNDHLWDPKMMVVVDRVAFERSLLLKSSDWDFKMVVARTGGRSSEVLVSSRFDCTGNCYYSMLSFHLIYFDIASSYITEKNQMLLLCRLAQ